MNLVQNIFKPARAWMWLHKTRLFVAGLILVIAAPRSIQSQRSSRSMLRIAGCGTFHHQRHHQERRWRRVKQYSWS